MIQPSELRIGNWICRINASNWLQVDSIDSSGSISFKGLDGHVFDLSPDANQQFMGILLTPEILEACGFEEHPDAYLLAATVYRLISHPEFIISLAKRDVDSALLPDVRIQKGAYFIWHKDKEKAHLAFLPALHQLQNLYFALTGQELTVNLTSNQSA